jgi:hypothetical protein
VKQSFIVVLLCHQELISWKLVPNHDSTSVRQIIMSKKKSQSAQPESGTVTGPASSFPSIQKKYGRSIAEWKKLIRSSPVQRHMELVNWLKSEYGMGHGDANALVAHTLQEDNN